MNKHNMNYSMATCLEGSYRKIIINKRAGNNWYFSLYGITEYSQKETPTYSNHKERNKSYANTYSKSSWAKTGFFIGALNILHLIIVYMNKHVINLPEDDRTIIIFAWGIITFVLAITGFCLSKKGYSEERTGGGYGIAGMALNGLIVLPAILFLIFAVSSSQNNKKR
jgi:hypothetical protein